MARAAATLFSARGFNGVSMREIASASAVSLGNIYNYFGHKEEIFEAALELGYEDFASPNTPLVRYLSTHNFPDDIADFASAMKAMVNDYPQYFRLVYVDAAEFAGAHVKLHYEKMAAAFGAFCTNKRTLAQMIAAYLLYSSIFAIEDVFGAKNIFGMPASDAQNVLADLFRGGQESQL